MASFIQYRLALGALFLLSNVMWGAQQGPVVDAANKAAQEKEKYALATAVTATNMNLHATGNNELRQFFKSTSMLSMPELRALVFAYVGPQWRPYKMLATTSSDQWDKMLATTSSDQWDAGSSSTRYGFWRGEQLRFENSGNNAVLPLLGLVRQGVPRAITWNVETGVCSGDTVPNVWNKGFDDDDDLVQRPAAYIETEDGVIRGQHLTRFYDRATIPEREHVGVVRQHRVQLDVNQTELLKKILAAPELPAAPGQAAAPAATTTTASTVATVGISGLWEHVVASAWNWHGAKK